MESITQKKKASLLNRRLAQLMQEKGLTLNALAKKAGLSIGAVQKIVTDPDCNPTISSLEALCGVFHVPLGYLIGETKDDNFNEMDVPLFSWDTLAEDLLNFSKGCKSKSKTQYISTSSASQYAFGLKIIDNSMPTIFPAETILIFDKQKPYYNGCYALIYLTQTKQYVFKKLLIDEPNLFMKSIHLELNKHDPIRIEKNQIIAVLACANFK